MFDGDNCIKDQMHQNSCCVYSQIPCCFSFEVAASVFSVQLPDTRKKLSDTRNVCLYIAVETEPDAVASESKTQKEAIDLKELKRIDHILSSLKRKVI